MQENQNTAVTDGENDLIQPGEEQADNNQEDKRERTFSQEDLNHIVGKRLSEEKTKLEAELAQRELELNQREFMFNAKAKLNDKGLPPELMDALNISTPEAFAKSLEIIERYLEKKKPVLNYGAKTNITEIPNRGDTSIRSAMGLK